MFMINYGININKFEENKLESEEKIDPKSVKKFAFKFNGTMIGVIRYILHLF